MSKGNSQNKWSTFDCPIVTYQTGDSRTNLKWQNGVTLQLESSHTEKTKRLRKVTNSSGYYPPKKRHQVSTWIRLQVTLSSLKLTPLNLRDLQKPKNQWTPRYLWQRWFTFYKQNSREKVRIYKGGSLASEGRQTMNFYRSKAALILQPTVHTHSPPLKWKTHFHNFTFHLHAKLKALLSPKVHLSQFREYLALTESV